MNQTRNLPKYVQLKNEIEEKINQGRYKPGDKLPTENELSQDFNISRHTVRKAMNILLNDGLLSRKPGVGTFLNKTPKKATKIIGFLSISVHDSIFSDILHGIEDVFYEKDYQILLASSKCDQMREKSILEQFIKRNVDGLIIEPAYSALDYPNIPLLERFVNNDIPVVILDSKFNNNKFHYVGVDDMEGGYMATKSLYDLGHEKIALVYNRVHLPLINRFEGYKKALEEVDIPVYLDYVKDCTQLELECGGDFDQQFEDVLLELMNTKKPPTAIFCINDKYAVKAKGILETNDYKIPDDVSIIGFDDSDLVKLNNISIASVVHPKENAGKKAAKIILECIDDGLSGAQENVIFSPEVILRKSVKKIK